MMKLVANNKCFVCGRENPAGLKIPFKVDRENKTISCEFTPGAEYQGFKGITHGGIIATLLDEAMVRLAFDLGIYAVTASIEVRYIAPLMSGETVYVSASITKEARKLLVAEAEACTIDGKAVARAKGKMLRV
ncbi:MAG: PaaI family thioesterase [Nitrospira sp.]|nr:PaaI family thioesterase [Nitrospira sp.]